nr:MAG TPA: hypothetical protein [Caudoviricetes sp.]
MWIITPLLYLSCKSIRNYVGAFVYIVYIMYICEK